MEIKCQIRKYVIQCRFSTKVQVGGDVSSIKQNYKAGTTIGGHRFVVTGADGRVYIADGTDPSKAGKIIGMTTHAAIENAQIETIKAGKIYNAGWGLTPNRNYFINSIGQLTLAKPLVGFIQVAGVSIDAENFEINLSQPIILS